MKKYLQIYKEFFRTCFNLNMSFPMNFTLQTLMNLVFLITSFLTASFIFIHVENIGLWNKEEFLFFLSFVFALDQTHYLFFSFNFWQFARDIRLGQLDFHLLKPAHSLFIVFTRNLAIPGLITAFISWLLLIYFGIKADINWIQWICLPLLLFLGLMFLLAIEILISLFNFLTVEGLGVNQVRLQLQHLCRWPDFIYKNPVRKWLLPFLAVTSVPGRFLIDMSYGNWVFFMTLGTVILWVILLFLWPKALFLYKSPSS